MRSTITDTPPVYRLFRSHPTGEIIKLVFTRLSRSRRAGRPRVSSEVRDPARLARVAKGGKLTRVMRPERRASRLVLGGVRHRAGARQFVARVRSQARSVRAYEVLRRRIHDLPREAGRV